MRAGQHPCYDRVVVDLHGPGTDSVSYDVRYVGVTTQGAGQPVPLRGGAELRLIVRAPAYDATGTPTVAARDGSEVVDVTGFRTLREVAWAGSFEGQTALGIGTRAQLPFRVFTLTGAPGSDQGMRLVVDVAHRW